MLATTSLENSAPQASTKCDFCDLHLKNDLDISRHLSSDSHRSKLAHFLSLQNLNTKSVQKEVPKNLVDVLKALKLRSDRDARELADKTFFKIYDDAIASIAMELNKSLFKSLVEFETRSLPPGVRAAFINALEPEQSSVSQTSASIKVTPKKSHSQPKKLVKESAGQPPKSSKDVPNSIPQGIDTTSAKVRVSPNSTQQQQTAPQIQKHIESQPARKPGQIPRIQRQEQPQKVQQQHPSNTNKQTQPSRPQQQSKPTPQPPPAASAQSVGRLAPTASDGQPLPRPNSTYVPKIAVVPRIKTEPKDD